MSPPKEITLELKVKVCTIKSETPSPVVHSCTDLEQYTQFLELMEEAYEDGLFVGREEGREEGISIGLERGLAQGAYEKALETARAMLVIGMTNEQVQVCTGLPLERVLLLQQEQGLRSEP